MLEQYGYIVIHSIYTYSIVYIHSTPTIWYRYSATYMDVKDRHYLRVTGNLS